MVDFGEIINSSAKWTINVLFKPFNFKKWMILTFIALLAGAMSNGCNLNFNTRYHPGGDKAAQATEVVKAPVGEKIADGGATPVTPKLSGAEKKIIITVVIIAGLALLALIVVLMWLSSRFSFVFLEDVIKNDASIKAPFKANREIGNSLFGFNLAFTAVFLALLGSLVFLCIGTFIKAGVFSKAAPDLKHIFQFIIILLPYLLVFLLLIIIAALIALVINDFVVTIMFKDRIKLLQAWSKAVGLLKKNVLNLILYILIKIGLAIGAGIAYFLISLVCVLVLLIPAALLGALLYLISKPLSPASLFIYWIGVGIVAAPVCLFLLYCLIALFLPIAVFFRTFSVKFLGRLDPQYDLIISSRETGLP